MILRKSTVAYLCTPQLTYARKALGAVAETQQEVHHFEFKTKFWPGFLCYFRMLCSNQLLGIQFDQFCFSISSKDLGDAKLGEAFAASLTGVSVAAWRMPFIRHSVGGYQNSCLCEFGMVDKPPGLRHLHAERTSPP